MTIKIRGEEAKDIEQVRELLSRAFPSEAERKLADVLRANNKAIISLVAFQEDQVLGHIMFSPVSTSPPSGATGIGLAPVTVHPDFQGQGLSSVLKRRAGSARRMNAGWTTNLCLSVSRSIPRQLAW